MLETELKCIITKDIYERIKSEFDWDSTAEQINYYYTDKNGVLRNNRIMVRVRAKGGVFRLQVKLHKNSGSPLQICEETEYSIDGAPMTIPPETTLKATGLDAGELVKMGGSVTLRSSLMWDDDTEICLDKTDYFDITDYEIEIEYKREPKKELLDKLDALGVVFNTNSIGKFSRFINRFEELNAK